MWNKQYNIYFDTYSVLNENKLQKVAFGNIIWFAHLGYFDISFTDASTTLQSVQFCNVQCNLELNVPWYVPPSWHTEYAGRNGVDHFGSMWLIF